jgi:tetratricopeptide (TPR) repeat protein
LIRARQTSVFVGRREQLRVFEENLALPVDDPRRRFLFGLHGDAGVGKTFLVRQFGRLARERGWLTAYVDHAVYDAPGAMSAVTAELERAGVKCREYADRFAAYQQRRHELAADPGAPEGLSSLLTRSAVRVGLRAAGDVPFVGALAGEVDAEAMAGQVDRLRQFLSGKFRNHDDVRLVMSPVDTLTPVFVRDLRVAAERAPLALFFDTYERTGSFLDPWLLDLLGGRHGELPVDVVFIIAGQHPLDVNRWGDFLGIRADMPLDVFSDAEARQLLSERGVTDDRVVDAVLGLSGRLPVLVAMLAESGPSRPGEVGDPSGSAVERFLRWETDDRYRGAALAGALPRSLDGEIFAAVAGEADALETFAWLRSLPFVVPYGNGYQYHDVVRMPMIRHLRRVSPQNWRERHGKLAEYFGALREATGLSERDGWMDEKWRGYTREERYHLLCAGAVGATARALEGLVDTYYWSSLTAVRSWVEMIVQAGRDADSADLVSRGGVLMRHVGEEADDRIALLTALVPDGSLSGRHRSRALAERGVVHRTEGRRDAAMRDLDRAVEIDPEHKRAFAQRGRTHREAGRLEEAVADLTRAVEIDPDYKWAFAQRGFTHREAGRLEEAVADLTRAVEIDPECDVAFAERGVTHREAGRLEEAVADLTRAVEIDPEDERGLQERGQAFLLLGRLVEARDDFERARQIDPADGWSEFDLWLVCEEEGRTEEGDRHLLRAISPRPREILDFESTLA